MLAVKDDVTQKAKRLKAFVTNKKFKIFNHPDFDDRTKEVVIVGDMPRLAEFNEKRNEVTKLKGQNIPTELIPLYQEPLLDKEQEYHLFRKFNYFKYRAKRLARTLRQKEPTTRDQYDRMKKKLQKVEDYLKLAETVKHQLVCSNTRLAAQVLRKRTDFYRAHSLVNDLLSDAYLNIVKAVDCFDWTRGFKFSTYGTWVLLNNFTRDLAGERNFNERFVTGFDDGIYDTRLDTSDEDCRDHEEAKELTQRNVSRLLSLLDREEDERKRFVIEEWFGLHDCDGSKRTLKEISADLGLTKERVRQLRERGLDRIRERLKAGDVKLD